MKHLSIATSLLALTITAVSASAAPKKKAVTASLETLFEQAETALASYNTETLDEALDNIETKLSKDRKAKEEDKEHLRRLQSQSITLSNMLGRVERIVIVDSLSVPRDDVPKTLRLATDAGHMDGSGRAVSYTPAMGREVFYTERDSTGATHIMHAGILDDGTREEGKRVELFADPAVQTAYPFMMPDGATLYFAADAEGDNALGGWDIYMTRRDEQGNFYEPTNVGMPYNSPANDFMMAIDETTGLGWWATDRNAPDSLATVYIFKPNPTRINYEPDSEDIADRAFITDYRATWPTGFNRNTELKRLADATGNTDSGNASDRFEFAVGNGKVYTSLADFRNPQARKLMQKYLAEKAELSKTTSQLDDLRKRYAAGDLNLRRQILTLEQQITRLNSTLRNCANAVVRAENR